MNWSHWIRQTHRWLSVVFTLAVLVTSVALAQEYSTSPAAALVSSRVVLLPSPRKEPAPAVRLTLPVRFCFWSSMTST